MTYQKANNIVKEYLFEESNRINQLKYKILERFDLIHYVYSLCLVKSITERIISELKEKTTLILIFRCGKKKENAKQCKNF